MSQPDSQPCLSIRGLSKEFPGVKALSDVQLDLYAGEVHALMGENGAGKSTLIKTLTGVYSRDTGTVTLHQKLLTCTSLREAEQAGISTVFQEINLIPTLSIAENIMLGREPRKKGFIDWKSLRKQASHAMESVGVPADVNQTLSSCSTALQQMVAIARALQLNAQVLILDEPTASLDEQEVDTLFRVLNQLKEQGVALLFVTHFLDQVYQICDRITVLRNGCHVGSYLTQELPRMELITAMLGKETAVSTATTSRESYTKKSAKPFLTAKNMGRGNSIKPFDFSIHTGEIIGLAGLLGSGRTEVVRLLFGLDTTSSGCLTINQQEIKNPTPRRLMHAGLAFCPEDRKREGVFLTMSVRENIILALQSQQGAWRTISKEEQVALADHYIEQLNIKTPNRETPVGNLSGGNQQKVLLARWLAVHPQLIILDEPTRGIDIGAKQEIERLINRLHDEGMAIIFISSELEEVVRISQRIAVMRDRQLIAMLEDENCTEKNILDQIAQHHAD